METKSFSIKNWFALIIFGLITIQSFASTIVSTSSGGRWDVAATWVGGVVPTSLDDVIIDIGANVIVRSPYTSASPAQCLSLMVNGTLTMGGGTIAGTRVIDVLSFLTISSGGVLTSDGFDKHRVSVGGNFTNLGTFTYSLNTGSIDLTFNGSTDQTIDGTATQSFGILTINKLSGKLSATTAVTSLSSTALTLTAGEFISPENLNVLGTLLLTSGVYTAGSNTTIEGNLTNNGASFSSGTGIVNFNGLSQIVGGSSSLTFNNVSTSGVTNTNFKNHTVINGTLSIGDGTKLTLENGITVIGTATVGNGTSGTLAITSASGTKIFSGHITISNGATLDNALGDNLHFHSGITSNGTLLPGTATYYFEINPQSINGTIAMPTVQIESGVTLTNNGNLTVANTLKGVGSFIQGSNSILNLGGTTTVNSFQPIGSNNTVIYNGSIAQTVRQENYVNLIISGSNVKMMRTATVNISGNLTVSGSAIATTVVGLSIGGNLSIIENASFSIAFGITVSGTTTIGNGTGGNVSITSQSGTKTFVGHFTIMASSTWNNSASDNIHFNGGLTNSGNFLAGSGTNYFEINPQSINGIVSMTLAQVGTGATLTNNGNISVTQTLGGLGSFIQGDNSILNLGGVVTVAVFQISGQNNTVNYNGGVQTIRLANYFNLGLSGSNVNHVKTWPLSITTIPGNLTLYGITSSTTISDLTVLGNLSIDTNASLVNGNSFTLTTEGVLSGDGKLYQSANSVLIINGESSLGLIVSLSSNIVHYNASSPHIIPGVYYDLMLNQSQGYAELDGGISVEGTLTLNTGSLDLKDSNLEIRSTATISINTPSETRMIITSGNGELWKYVNGLGSVFFPIGESTGVAEYSPVTINITSGSNISSTSAIRARVVDAKHPSNNSSQNFLTRYWVVSDTAITNCTIDFSGVYSNDNIEGAENSIVAGELYGTFNQITNSWKKLSGITNNVFTATATLLDETQPKKTYFTGINNSVPTVSITGGNVSTCSGTSVSLGATVTGEAPFLYSWSPSTGLSATDVINPLATPSITTNYMLTVYDGNGFSVSDNTTITVQSITTTVNNLTLCAGNQGTLTAAGADTYEWTPAAGLSMVTGASVTATPTETTIYSVKGTQTSSGCNSTAQATVTILPLPAKPSITASDLTTENPKLTSSSASGNQWFKDGGNISGATNQILTISTDGSYTVQVTTSGCTGPVSDAYTIVITGINEGSNGFNIFPNPATDVIWFDRSSFEVTEVEIKVYDYMGRLHIEKILPDSENSISVRNLSQGSYFFMASQNKRLVVKKFTKN